MNKVGILYHPLIEATRVKAGELEQFLTSSGVSVWLCSAWETEEARARLDGTDLVLSVGGDGTILHAAQAAAPAGIPLIGINLGKLGFMTELGADEALAKLPMLLSGKGWIDERAMLEAELVVAGQAPRRFQALNEVVVARGAIARVVYVETSIGNQPLATYKADGLIVATATGSTGYALAAGGPILYPRSRDFILLPIVPHLSLGYPLVLPASAEVKMRLTTVHQATLSIDGHINLPLATGDAVTVRLGANTTRFLRIHPENYFYGSLEPKLKGKK